MVGLASGLGGIEIAISFLSLSPLVGWMLGPEPIEGLPPQGLGMVDEGLELSDLAELHL